MAATAFKIAHKNIMTSQAAGKGPTAPQADVFHEPKDFRKQNLQHGGDTATQHRVHKLLGTDEDLPSQLQRKTHPSPQLVDYLHSPLIHDQYTGVAARGQDVAVQRQNNMKEFLKCWEKDWEKMAAAKDK